MEDADEEQEQITRQNTLGYFTRFVNCTWYSQIFYTQTLKYCGRDGRSTTHLHYTLSFLLLSSSFFKNRNNKTFLHDCTIGCGGLGSR